VENCYDVGGGKAMGYINTGHWLDYKVSVSEARTFVFSLRVATPFSGGVIEVRNASGVVLSSINLPNTGNWQRWVTVNTELNLPKGDQTLRLYVKSGGFNLNWFQTTKLDYLPFASNGNPTTFGNMQENKQLTVYPNPFTTTATVEFSVPKGESAKVELYNIQGVLVETLFNSISNNDFINRVTIDGGKYANGIYIVKLTIGKQIQNTKVILQK
jgi:hypothetical protein